jgi:hypothetical protein
MGRADAAVGRTGQRLKRSLIRMGNRFCIFCANPADSREHLYPDWILQTLEDRRPFRQRLGNGSYRIFSGEITIRCVCSKCNHGWMSTLENSLTPLMKPMVLGESTLLDERYRQWLAAWAVKTVMVSEGTRTINCATLLLPERRQELAAQSVAARSNQYLARPTFHVRTAYGYC